MKFTKHILTVLAALAFTALGQELPTIVNPGFETPLVVGATKTVLQSRPYGLMNHLAPDWSGSGWVLLFRAFYGTQIPIEGEQSACLLPSWQLNTQAMTARTAESVMWQTVPVLPGATYTFSFKAAQRGAFAAPSTNEVFCTVGYRIILGKPSTGMVWVDDQVKVTEVVPASKLISETFQVPEDVQEVTVAIYRPANFGVRLTYNPTIKQYIFVDPEGYGKPAVDKVELKSTF